MRIAQVSPYSWSRPGGVRRHVTGLSQALLDRGHNVEIIAPDGDDAESAALERDRPDVPVHSVGTSVPIHDSGSVVPIALSPAAAARTARLVRSARYDLVHVHEPMIPAVALTAATTAHAPVVGTVSRRRRCTIATGGKSPRWTSTPNAFSAPSTVESSRTTLGRQPCR